MFPQVLLLGMVLLATGSPEDNLPATEGTKSLPCGLSSLYFLEHLCGKEFSLDDLRAQLRTDVDGNCSFRDIIEAGHRTGLKLVAYQLRPTDPIDRPMIVSLQNGKGGHFVVVRPVGHTGKLVQVLDYPDDPALLDESVFRSSGRWTGIVLTPMSPRPLLPYALILLGILLCALAWYFRPRAQDAAMKRGQSDEKGSGADNRSDEKGSGADNRVPTASQSPISLD